MDSPRIHSLFEHAAARFPDRIAVREEEREISFRDLDHNAGLLARTMREHPAFFPGSRVALTSCPGIDFVTAMLAVLKAGAVFVPLDLRLPEKRRQMLIDKVKPVGLVHDQEFESLDRNDFGPACEADGCYVMFTSGSTGEPKAILGSHKGLAHFIHWEIAEFGLNETVLVSQLAPPTFDVSLRDLFVPLTTGGSVCVPSLTTRTRIDRLVHWLDSEDINLIHCVPSLFRAIMTHLELASRLPDVLRNLRHVLLAGEPLYVADVIRWRALMGKQIELVNLYGPSETTLAKAFHRIRELPGDPSRMVPIGKALPDTRLLVLLDGEECETNAIGEIHIETDFRSLGYFQDPDRNAENFICSPIAPDANQIIYRSGDLGRYLADGTMVLVGRRDGQVKVNGIRIELAEIEQVMRRLSPIEQVVVVAHPGPDRGTHLAAYFIAPRPVSDSEIRQHLSNWLPESMHPSFLIQIREFPLNLHGKVIRRELPMPAGLLYSVNPFVAPDGELEITLAQTWDQVLGIGSVSVTHTFVELGGTSLKATEVLGRISEELNVDLKLNELFPRGTIRDLARIIRLRERDLAIKGAGEV